MRHFIRRIKHYLFRHRLFYHLDEIVETELYIRITGWVFHVKEKTSSVQILVSSTCRHELYEAIHELIRLDVHAIFRHPQAILSGFTAFVEKKERTGKVCLSLYLSLPSGRKIKFYQIKKRLENDHLHSIGLKIKQNRAMSAKLPRPQNNQINIFCSSRGNYFFREIADLLAYGLREAGYTPTIKDETYPILSDPHWNIILAPHEFFFLGKGNTIRVEKLPPNIIIFNTEQPSSHWFSRAAQYFKLSAAVWDMDFQTASRLNLIFGHTYFCPLGYQKDFPAYQWVPQLPRNFATISLDSRISTGNYQNSALCERPIDIIFIGHASERRQKIFSRLASFFSRYNCYWEFYNLNRGPARTGETTSMDSATVIGLMQRSKIMLNVHHGWLPYFEWHRIVLHGFWQKTLVLTEPVPDTPPFLKGRDYAQAPWESFPEKIAYYLDDPTGRREAQQIVDQAHRTLVRECSLAIQLRSSLSKTAKAST